MLSGYGTGCGDPGRSVLAGDGPVDMRSGADRLLAQVVQMLGAAQRTMPGCSPTAAATG